MENKILSTNICKLNAEGAFHLAGLGFVLITEHCDFSAPYYIPVCPFRK